MAASSSLSFKAVAHKISASTTPVYRSDAEGAVATWEHPDHRWRHMAKRAMRILVRPVGTLRGPAIE